MDNGLNYMPNEDSDEVSNADKNECPAKNSKLSTLFKSCHYSTETTIDIQYTTDPSPTSSHIICNKNVLKGQGKKYTETWVSKPLKKSNRPTQHSGRDIVHTQWRPKGKKYICILIILYRRNEEPNY